MSEGTGADTAGDGAGRALDGLGELRELDGRLHEAAIVVPQNDPTRLSLEATRYQPGPHRENR